MQSAIAVILSGIVLGSGAAASQPKSWWPARSDAKLATTKDGEQLRAFDGFDLVLPVGLPESIDVCVSLGGEQRVLRLGRRSLRAPTFRLLVDVGDGRLAPASPPASQTYRGSIVGEPNSEAAASLLESGLVAVVERADGQRYFIEPLAGMTEGAAPGQRVSHVSYRERDVRDHSFHCGVDGLLGRRRTASRDARKGESNGGVAGVTKYLAEIAFDADFEFFQKNASSLANTVADIEAVMAQVEFIYDRDVDIDYEIVTIVVRTSSNDPYTATAADDLLCEFRSTWNTAPESEIKREVAHLFTGKNLDGGTIGLGWVEAVCNVSALDCGAVVGDVAYSLVESKFAAATLSQRVALSCHELGHNWGAGHCDGDGDCHIMCSTMGSCDGIAGADLKFGANEQADIVSYRESVACDLALAPPLSLPFAESWSASSISTGTWIFEDGAAVSTAAANEPSEPYSLVLNSTGGGLYGDDQIRSNTILCGVPDSLTLTYFTQHKGVEAGEHLIVEYWSSAGAWVTIESVVSDGINQTTFTEHAHVLPPAAMHDQFRLRFSTDGNETNDKWFIDDITIAPTPACTADLDDDGDVDPDDLAILLGGWGPCPGCPGDIDASGSVSGFDITLLLAVWGSCPSMNP